MCLGGVWECSGGVCGVLVSFRAVFVVCSGSVWGVFWVWVGVVFGRYLGLLGVVYGGMVEVGGAINQCQMMGEGI